MSNRYRLIKEYPGSPKLDSIVEIKNNGGYELENSTSYFMTKDKVENYPEFWEEVVEKDYEIVSLVCDRPSKTIITYENGGSGYPAGVFERVYKSKDKWLHAFAEINANIWKIHSVKRKFDGEIFTIGDFVNGRTISSFSINWIEIGLKIHCDDVGKGNINDGCFFKLQDLEKVKQPLFTTEDGVDIFEGDTFTHTSGWAEPKVVIAKSSKHTNYSLPMDKLFSTKEKAKEYILMNKPCLSINEILSLSKGFRDKEHLKKLVQQKLNK